MILFTNNNNGILFIDTIIDVIVDVVSTAFSKLLIILPHKKNTTLGVMTDTDIVYCRKCAEKLRIKYDSHIKYITYLHTLPYKVYNCVKCGLLLSKENSYQRVGI